MSLAKYGMVFQLFRLQFSKNMIKDGIKIDRMFCVTVENTSPSTLFISIHKAHPQAIYCQLLKYQENIKKIIFGENAKTRPRCRSMLQKSCELIISSLGSYEHTPVPYSQCSTLFIIITLTNSNARKITPSTLIFVC